MESETISRFTRALLYYIYMYDGRRLDRNAVNLVYEDDIFFQLANMSSKKNKNSFQSKRFDIHNCQLGAQA